MRLDEYIEGFQPDESARRRRLAEEKSYEIIDYVEDLQTGLQSSLQGDSLVGSTSPSVFVGRSSYPNVSTGILAPVGQEDTAAEFATSGEWYQRGLDIENVLQYRTGLLNSRRSAKVDVEDVWDGFVGTQREVAIADRPVDVEIGLRDTPEIDLDRYRNPQANAPSGPSATADRAELGENPHVPRQVKKTLEDDDWRAEGAMTYLYRRGFDVYDINQVLSVGALGQSQNRRLVPTRWSITAVDDTVSKFLRGSIRNAPSIDQVQVFVNEYIGNRYWVVLAPGSWEFELVEMKAPGSIWNPEPTGEIFMSSAYENYEGRSGYVEETAGAYYAARLGVLEYLESIGRQAKALVLREVSDDYWAPVGVWQVRESVRNAFEEGPKPDLAGEPGVAETFESAIGQTVPHLPVSLGALRRKSELVAGRQAGLADFQA
ncbi:DNA repair protein NreA [Halodesulfurarchaeum sp. HSR-GB]|uniref:DNA repair protein NreA n=1 Tax=Halodesulfurarchaeum sp. HSR-GB TaxID=3074077 RepID=UPI00285E2D37|nr:DNA repair protein NreA [Halodesulfurarchaeum sp. HSR-GB]MDR5656811.1 DNA repair protein NreA [Halodesulfurarchaeum sp. HSR-GB]